MKRILVLDKHGKRVCIPRQLFNNHEEIEAFMDANYPDCIYASDFEWNRDENWNETK